MADLKNTLVHGQRVDYITLSGSGEPTLHSQIGRIIEEIKEITNIPVAILTNGTLFTVKRLREEIVRADLVIPSLDAASQEIFETINRPHPALNMKEIIKGLIAFRGEFKGQIWLEVMLVKGVNDGAEAVRSLRKVIPELGCDKIQLNTVIRPPSEDYARSLNLEGMLKVKKLLGQRCEIVPRFSRQSQKAYREDLEQRILDLVARRPVSIRDISSTLGMHENEVIKYMETLTEAGQVKAERFSGQFYYHR
jgi:wyosine [tRNA(Phe)-imidazoG37] synthetase (radical SAM superfamily)